MSAPQPQHPGIGRILRPVPDSDADDSGSTTDTNDERNEENERNATWG